MSSKPSIPKGTRDYHPEIVLKRNYITDIIKKVFISYGYLEIKTPSFEKIKTLSGKYGNEGDRLIFNILNSGEKVKKADINSLKNNNTSRFISSISEKALRYDLTVPLARYVSQHQNEIKFPFKRFQIQNVWRADRPQKGRYQEFTQCDADVIGSSSLYLEFEMIQMYSTVFKRLGLNKVEIKINHREILASISRKIELNDNFLDFVIILDKLSKIGIVKVINELKEKLGLKDKYQSILEDIFKIKSSVETLKLIKNELIDNKSSDLAYRELKELYDLICINSDDIINFSFDLNLARGLDYYTGAIFEVVNVSNDDCVGSLGGGGRYKNLTERFNSKNLPGIGISFGLERIFHSIDDNDLFPDHIKTTNDVLVINFGKEYIYKILPILNKIRNDRNISIYPDSVKLSKQFTYADKNKFNYVIIFGEEEMKKEIFKIKNLDTGKEYINSIQIPIEDFKF
tara:strand:+ start:3125 stop:4498 length:1374 start_codon:yes stop_codon:yes gene_type:complete